MPCRVFYLVIYSIKHLHWANFMRTSKKTPSQVLLASIAPVIAGSTFAILPAQAATFSLSEGDTVLTNFSQEPYSTDVSTTTKTRTFAALGESIATAAADAIFLNTTPELPATGAGSTSSTAEGTGTIYKATSSSQSTVVGKFLVPLGTAFTFDFTSSLTLQAALDTPQTETAESLGHTFFNLIDTNSGRVLDSFGLTGSISFLNPSSNAITFQSGKGVTEAEITQNTTSTDSLLSATMNVVGKYVRTFQHFCGSIGKSIDLTLIEVNKNLAKVAAKLPDSNSSTHRPDHDSVHGKNHHDQDKKYGHRGNQPVVSNLSSADPSQDEPDHGKNHYQGKGSDYRNDQPVALNLPSPSSSQDEPGISGNDHQHKADEHRDNQPVASSLPSSDPSEYHLEGADDKDSVNNAGANESDKPPLAEMADNLVQAVSNLPMPSLGEISLFDDSPRSNLPSGRQQTGGMCAVR